MEQLELIINGIQVLVLEGPYLIGDKISKEGEAFANDIIKNIATTKEATADKMLTLYNEVWLDEAIGELTKEAFIEKLVNPSITLYDEEGVAVLYFETSDMFSDHLIDVDYQGFKLSSISLA